MRGRSYVLPDDIRTLARPVLAHRILSGVEAAMSGRNTMAILESIVSGVPVPEVAQSSSTQHRAAPGA